MDQLWSSLATVSIQSTTSSVSCVSPREEVRQAVLTLWNRNDGWIPGAAYKQLAETLDMDPELFLKTRKARICAYCDRLFWTKPVRDPDEVTWRGSQAKIWCSEKCMAEHAEQIASSDPLGRSDLR